MMHFGKGQTTALTNGQVIGNDGDLASGSDWLRCPRCGGKTRTQVRPHTVLEDFPLFCPKCRYTCVIDFKDGKTEEIEMPDA